MHGSSSLTTSLRFVFQPQPRFVSQRSHVRFATMTRPCSSGVWLCVWLEMRLAWGEALDPRSTFSVLFALCSSGGEGLSL